MKKHFIAGWGGYPLIGTPEQIVDGLVRMSKMGLDGTLLNWPRYIEDQRWFKDQCLSAGGAGRIAVSAAQSVSGGNTHPPRHNQKYGWVGSRPRPSSMRPKFA